MERKGAKSQRRKEGALKTIHHPVNTFSYQLRAEVDHQRQTQIHHAQICQSLHFKDCVVFGSRLAFNDNKITDKQVPESYAMHVEGKGPAGQISGVGKLTLVDEGERTRVEWTGDANVRGTLARVGGRVMQPAAKMIVGQFFNCLEAKAAK